MSAILFKRLGMAIGIVAILITVWIFSYVEDWSRDFSKNTAETSPDAIDERLRPIETTQTPDEIVAILKGLPNELSNWEVDGEATVDGDKTIVPLIRSTAFMKFKDDITVTLSVRDGKTIITAFSKSRVGKGDLGQNPRNLRELLAWLRKKLP